MKYFFILFIGQTFANSPGKSSFKILFEDSTLNDFSQLHFNIEDDQIYYRKNNLDKNSESTLISLHKNRELVTSSTGQRFHHITPYHSKIYFVSQNMSYEELRFYDKNLKKSFAHTFPVNFKVERFLDVNINNGQMIALLRREHHSEIYEIHNFEPQLLLSTENKTFNEPITEINSIASSPHFVAINFSISEKDKILALIDLSKRKIKKIFQTNQNSPFINFSKKIHLNEKGLYFWADNGSEISFYNWNQNLLKKINSNFGKNYFELPDNFQINLNGTYVLKAGECFQVGYLDKIKNLFCKNQYLTISKIKYKILDISNEYQLNKKNKLFLKIKLSTDQKSIIAIIATDLLIQKLTDSGTPTFL